MLLGGFKPLCGHFDDRCEVFVPSRVFHRPDPCGSARQDVQTELNISEPNDLGLLARLRWGCWGLETSLDLDPSNALKVSSQTLLWSWWLRWNCHIFDRESNENIRREGGRLIPSNFTQKELDLAFLTGSVQWQGTASYLTGVSCRRWLLTRHERQYLE